MAADQRRKRLICARIAPSGTLEQHKVKKRKLEAFQTNLNAKSHISLEWDGNQKRVVAKREQIGISWRHLRPFVECAPNHHNLLGDVVTLPHEIFELNGLTDALSYEVWQTHLSEKERRLLMQFLPKGIDEEQVLQTLFAGANFQFGNPFVKWGESVCSGQLHPDAVISHEKYLKADKNAYYSELQKYHTETIGFLQKLKKNWESCEDPEIDDVQRIWWSKRNTEQGIALLTYESRLADPEQDSSESCSWNADEKACSSNNQDSSAGKVVEFQKRNYTKGFIKDKHRTSLITSDKVPSAAAKPRNGNKLQKRNMQQNDGSKYMSYVKISKKQHQLVESMKQPGQSIQSRSLNRVLGSLDGLHVQPYEVFMEEEQRKLHEHWQKLASEHLPAAYANWRHVKLQKREIINSLNQDLHGKLNAAFEDGEESAKNPQHQGHNIGVNPGVLDEDRENLNHVFQDREDKEPIASESSIGDVDATMVLFHNQSCQQISFDSSGFCDNRKLESEKVQLISKSDDTSSDASEYSGDLEANQGVHMSSAEDVWAGHITPHSYHDSMARREYTSASGLSLTCHSDNDAHRSQMIDLTSGLPKEETEKVLLQDAYRNDSYNDSTARHAYASGGGLPQTCHQDSGAQGSQPIDLKSGLPKEDSPKVFLQDSYHDSVACHEYTSTSGLSLTCHQENGAQRSQLFDLVSGLPREDTHKALLQDSYHDSTALHEFAPTSGLSLACHQDSGAPRSQLIDLKSGLSVKEREKILLQGEMNDVSFNCYPNQPRNDLLQSLFKDRRVLPYNHERKQTGLDFQPSKNMVMGDSRFPGHFQEHMQPSLPLEQNRQNEMFLLQNMSPNIYSNGGRYIIPEQELLPAGHMADWSVNPLRMTVPYQQQLGSGDLFGQNLFPSTAHQVDNGWNVSASGGVSGPNGGIGSASSADQSLFSVLSQCSQLPSGNSFGSTTRSTDQFIPPVLRNGNNPYGMMGVGNPAMMNNNLPQASQALDYLGGRDAMMAAPAADDMGMGWMNLQHQNPGLHDPMGRPYLRSWNQ